MKQNSSADAPVNEWQIPDDIFEDITRLCNAPDFVDSVSREVSLYELARSMERITVPLEDRKEHANDMVKAVKALKRRFAIIEKYDSHNPSVRNQHDLMEKYWTNYKNRLDSVTGRITRQKAARTLIANLIPVFHDKGLDRQLSRFIISAVEQVPGDTRPPSETLIRNCLKELRTS